MSLPKLPAGDKYRREVRTEWGGINLNENAGDGELIEALNMSSREFPLLANARLARSPMQEEIITPYTYDGQMGWIAALSPDILLYDPTRPDVRKALPSVASDGKTQITILGKRMLLIHEPVSLIPGFKKVYDFETGVLSDLDASWAVGEPEFYSGVYFGTEDAIVPSLVDLPAMPDFEAGQALTITGCIRHESNNKTVILRKVSVLGGRPTLYFDAGTFDFSYYHYLYDEPGEHTLPVGRYHFYIPINGAYPGHIYGFTLSSPATNPSIVFYPDNPVEVYVNNQSVPVTELEQEEGTFLYFAEDAGETTFEPGGITITREIPDLDFVFVNENRVWGCKGDTIYCSKPGDPYNWNVFDGLSTDSWSVETGTPGDFTGCCSYQGYPTFFKENAVFKVLGDTTQNFVLRKINIQGVKAGSAQSIVEIRSQLYYLSPVGVMQWNGGDTPIIISTALGGEPGQFNGANAGTDGIRYYMRLAFQKYNAEFEAFLSAYALYAYDTRYGTWHEIILPWEFGDVRFTGDGTKGWMTAENPPTEVGYGHIYALHEFPTAKNTETEWRVTFADSTRAYKTALTGSESKKAVLRLLIRCRLAGSMKVWIAYDGGDFEQAGEFGGEDGMAKTSRVVPLILRRCDFWQLRLTGVGDAVIYSIAAERYGGEWQQA